MAPYEADAQIAFLVKEGLADFALSEDSDLLAFKCPKVNLYITNKMRQTVYLSEKFKKLDYKCRKYQSTVKTN